MKTHISANEATYGPQQYKTFAGALTAFFSEECPQLGGMRTRQVLSSTIISMVNKFYPETSHLKPGQTPWVTTDKNATKSYGKKINQTPLVSVILDLVRAEDIQERKDGKKLRDIKKEAVARMLKQSYKQGGCMTSVELAILLKISPPTVGKYIKEWELEHSEVLPRRGSIHDMGPTLTHKKIIIEKLFIKKLSVQQVSRETYHSFQAIQRYISKFKQVLICYKKDMNINEIAKVVGNTPRLIKEYEAIILEYKDRGFVLEQIINTDAKVDSQYETIINDLNSQKN